MRSHYVRSFAIAALPILGILPAAAQAPLVDLGVATGYAINNAGQVVLSTGIYSNGTVTPLPALPGQTTPAVGAAINASGQIAGSALTLQPYSAAELDSMVPVEFSSGTLTILQSPIVYGGGTPSEAYATGINSSAEIVGYSVSPDLGIGNIIQGYYHEPFLYANGKLVTGLPILPTAINDSDQMTGNVSYGNNTLHAQIYDYGTGTLTDLGQGAATAINNAGEATGTLDGKAVATSGGGILTPSYAFLYSNGTTINLGALPGATDASGYAINSTGQVAGSSGGHAFFYTGVMADLNSLITASDPLKQYVTLNSAVGINDGLLILANGVDSRTNSSHAYLYQAAFIQFAPSTLDFAMPAVGGTSPAQSVTVTNTGTTALPVGAAYVNGDFSLRADNCATSLAPGDQCHISVVFLAKVAGALSGALTIPVGGANYQVPLSGVVPIAATVSASSAAATVGQAITVSWTASPSATCTAVSSSTNGEWTASSPPFTGPAASNGSQTLTETINGTVTYKLICDAPGVAEARRSAAVVWSWPPVTVSISASPATITAGQSTTLTWKSSNATNCTVTGGGPGDNWPGTKATSGSQKVTEPFALDTSSVALTFGITCNSTTTGLSGQASVKVTEDQAPAGSGSSPTSSEGGGGALNPLSLALLAGILALRRARVRILPMLTCPP
jgi:hypothetical protein